jgi:hypothetical protein
VKNLRLASLPQKGDRQPSEPAFNTRKKAAQPGPGGRMKLKTANIDIRVEPRLIEKIDAWRTLRRVPPSRAEAIGYMLEYFLKHDRLEHPAGFPAAWFV